MTPTTVPEDWARPVAVLANDTDIDGGPTTIASVTQPANGTVLITGGGTGLTYEPDANYCNGGSPTDDFTYTLNGGDSATVAMSVTCIDDPPVAVDDSDDRARGRRARRPVDVLGNDTDIDGGPKTIPSVTQPANGTVVITGGGAGLTYEPDANYCNGGSPTDDFTYTLNGGDERDGRDERDLCERRARGHVHGWSDVPHRGAERHVHVQRQRSRRLDLHVRARLPDVRDRRIAHRNADARKLGGSFQCTFPDGPASPTLAVIGSRRQRGIKRGDASRQRHERSAHGREALIRNHLHRLPDDCDAEGHQLHRSGRATARGP